MRTLRSNKVRPSFTIETLEDRRLMAVAASDDTMSAIVTAGNHAVAYDDVAVAAPMPVSRSATTASHTVSSLSDAISRAGIRSATSMTLVGEVPGGMRGEKTPFTVLLRDAAGKPLAGQKIDFTQVYRGRDSSLGSVTTDASGQATLTYKIPTESWAEKVSLTARFGGTSNYKSSSYTVSRVEIGRKSPAVDVSGPSAEVDEGSGATFTFSLTEAAKTPVTVTYATADRTAVAGSDYVDATGTITFAAGERTKKVTVATLTDADVDPNESFTMKIVSVKGANVGSAPSTTATIRDTTPPPPAATGSWTVLVYMTGSNLNDFARDDINEMEKALQSLPAGVRIVVGWDQPAGLTDHATGGGAQAAWGTYGRSVLNADSNMSSIVSTFDLSLGERNTGDPTTLVDFVKWGVEKSPAQRYVLQMWGHGAGYIGSQFDTESHGDALTMAEMVTALATPGMPRVDVLAYDNCLMAMAEVGAAVAPHIGGVFVASEEVVGGAGQDYTTAYARLAVANPEKVTPVQIAEGMVTSYQRQYQGSPFKQDTLSAVSTAGYAALNAALAGFVSASRGLTDQHRTVLVKAAKAGPSYASDDGYSNVDLSAFMTRVKNNQALPEAVRSAAAGVKTALAAMVTSRTVDQRKSGGVAVYLPTSADDADLASYPTDAADFCRATGWDQFVRWMATGDRTARSSGSGGSGRAERMDGGAIAGIPQAAWAAYAAEWATGTAVETPNGLRRPRV